MNFSLPVILGDLTGSSDDLVQKNGFVFPTDNVSEFSEALNKMAALSDDKENEWGKSAKKISKIIAKHR